MVSACPDGEGVKVVGEDRPSGPGLHPVVVLEPRAAHAVAAFDVADPALAAGPVSRESSLRSSAAGLLAAGDERPLGLEAVQRPAGRAGLEAAVERDLAR